MPFTNLPVMTVDELLKRIASIASTQAVDVENGLQMTLMDFSDRIKNRFYINFPLPFGACEVDLNRYGIDDVENVEKSCGNGCWHPIRWHREQDNRIIFDGRDGYNTIRVTYWEAPTMLSETATLLSDYTIGDTSIHIDVQGYHPILRVPASGTVLVNHDDGQKRWMEYRGIFFRESGGGMDLLGVQQHPSLEVLPSPNTIAAGNTLLWGIGFPSSFALGAVIKQTLAYYWATQTGQCKNEDDRSSAMQLMNYWSDEAEKAWRNVSDIRRPIVRRQRYPGG